MAFPGTLLLQHHPCGVHVSSLLNLARQNPCAAVCQLHTRPAPLAPCPATQQAHARPAPVQVYYIPRLPFYAQSTLPTFVGAMRLLRSILIRERITVVHAHQAFSTLGLEALLQARTMGYKVRPKGH